MYGKDEAIIFFLITISLGAYVVAFKWQKDAGDQIKKTFKTIFENINVLGNKIINLEKMVKAIFEKLNALEKKEK